jgi:hypothetical protein
VSPEVNTASFPALGRIINDVDSVAPVGWSGMLSGIADRVISMIFVVL